MTEYQINPCAKPRMTQADKWKKRPIVMRYRAFKDMVRAMKIKLPEAGASIVFHIAMPDSWSEKKKGSKFLAPHQSRPDLDNFLKGLFDAVYEEDSHIWDVKATKIWDYKGYIVINFRYVE